jgi:hypothetical protein
LKEAVNIGLNLNAPKMVSVYGLLNWVSIGGMGRLAEEPRMSEQSWEVSSRMIL